MTLRDRVKDLWRVPAKDLLPNRKNWRKLHRAEQSTWIRTVILREAWNGECGDRRGRAGREGLCVLRLSGGNSNRRVSSD
jgi:hypothetical protein